MHTGSRGWTREFGERMQVEVIYNEDELICDVKARETERDRHRIGEGGE